MRRQNTQSRAYEGSERGRVRQFGSGARGGYMGERPQGRSPWGRGQSGDYNRADNEPGFMQSGNSGYDDADMYASGGYGREYGDSGNYGGSGQYGSAYDQGRSGGYGGEQSSDYGDEGYAPGGGLGRSDFGSRGGDRDFRDWRSNERGYGGSYADARDWRSQGSYGSDPGVSRYSRGIGSSPSTFGSYDRAGGPGSPYGGYGGTSAQSTWGSLGREAGGYGPSSRSGQRRAGPKGYQRSDDRIKDDVCERLYNAYDLDVEQVGVEVQSGKVTLDGTVPERYMKHRIEDLVEEIHGVDDIDNRIRVSRDALTDAGSSQYATGSEAGRSSQSDRNPARAGSAHGSMSIGGSSMGSAGSGEDAATGRSGSSSIGNSSRSGKKDS